MNEVGQYLLFNLDLFGLPYIDFLKTVQSKGGSICGGFALGIANRMVFQHSDIDVFQCCTDTYDDIHQHIYSIVLSFHRWQYKLECYDPNYPYKVLTFYKMVNNVRKKVQWILHTPENGTSPMDHFDLTICCCAIEFPFGRYFPVVRCLYPEDVVSGFIKINQNSHVVRTVLQSSKKRTALRIVKYMKRGYICDPSFPNSLDDFLDVIVDSNEENMTDADEYMETV
jgi:hypothetical protein